jgi:hypothetical protein
VLARPCADRRHLLALFAVVATIYFATFGGVTASNDGSHYALVRALVARRPFEISPYLAFTENQDFATGPGGRYSDRPPGTAIWAAPFYAVARLLPAPLVELPSKHDRGNPRVLGVGAATAVAGAGAVALFWLLLRRRFGRSLFASGLAAVALALGTATWKYGSVLYSHSLSALLVLVSLYLALRPGPRRAPAGLLLGLALGASVIVEYSNALLVALVALYLAASSRATPARELVGPALGLLVGLAVPLAFLGLYDQVNFGCPWCVSTFQVDLARWPNAAGMPSAFATPLAEGLAGMLWWGGNNQGLFLLSPVAWLALLGIGPMLRGRPLEAALVLAVFVAFLLLFAKSTNFNPLTNDGRYLTPFLALWLVPLAFWVDEFYLRLTSDGARLVASLLLFGLLFLSIRNQLMHVAFSWNYDLKYADLLNMSTPVPNITRLLGTVFPNAANVWWLWLLLAPPAALARWLSR